MSVFKCKMCGGTLEVREGATVCECEYCGTRQTISASFDETIRSLFNRANSLRMRAEFDKAGDLYEKILQLDSTEAEAYWGLILCKYGVEYVEDPKTLKRIPTCHRTSFDAVTADDDYKNAVYYASADQKTVYEAEAKAIDEIQKGILSISGKEDPYDVFICYKETDENGKRTMDSVIANDIYYQLTQQGFKVFYAAITLEDKLGTEYEPYIFSALNSSKVMLALGTKPEYFNAVWVKNEWSRFLQLMKKDRSKLLIPCYRDMDAYELPEEFVHLQAQDMSKIGFINDIVRGIKKVVVKDENKPAAKETAAAVSASSGVAPLLKRAFMFLEDGDWAKADDFCEQVLNQDPENAQAYLGKLMAEQHVRTQEELQNCEIPFDKSTNFLKVMRFSENTLRTDLTKYIEHINTRNEIAQKQSIYDSALQMMKSKNASEETYINAAELFRSIIGFNDAEKLVDVCTSLANKKKLETVNASIKKKKTIIKISIIVVIIIGLLLVLALFIGNKRAGEIESNLVGTRFIYHESDSYGYLEFYHEYLENNRYRDVSTNKGSVATSVSTEEGTYKVTVFLGIIKVKHTSDKGWSQSFNITVDDNNNPIHLKQGSLVYNKTNSVR